MMDSILHPGPFAATTRDGGHVVVDAHDVVILRAEGLWPHRTAAAAAHAMNTLEPAADAHAEEVAYLEEQAFMSDAAVDAADVENAKLEKDLDAARRALAVARGETDAA